MFPTLVHFGMSECGKILPRFYIISIRGCLELLNRTARAIAGHIEDYLGKCSSKETLI